MAGSLFKSRPKSDRRKEWKSLKDSNAKALTAQKIKVEIGLGKELDNFQKQIDKVLTIDETSLTKASLGPVVTAGKKVELSVDTLKPKVKGFNDLTKFLTALEKDVEWWNKAAGNLPVQTRHVGGWEASMVPEAVEHLKKAKPLMAKLDTLLSKALKATATYDPPREFTYWAQDSKTLKPAVAKLTVLKKDTEGSHELARELLVDHKETLSHMRWVLSGMNRLNLNGLPALTDWNAVKKTSSDLANYIDEASRVANGLKK